MNRFRYMLLALLTAVPVAWSADCVLPPLALGLDGRKLTLVGAGVRTHWLRSVNAVALYAATPPADWPSLASSADEARVDVVFFSERFTREQLRESWRERFAVIFPASEQSVHAVPIAALLDLFDDAARGDTLSFSSSPQGLVLSRNGQRLGAAGDLAFSRRVLSSWLGDQPAAIEVKARIFEGFKDVRVPCTTGVARQK